jgi:SAM-dependent methyltransferase
VFSNAALHWMREPDRVIEGVRRALCPGGRFVGEMGGEGNVGAVRAALVQALAEHGIDATPLDPWYFPSCKEYQQRLERSAFIIDTIVLFPRPTVLPTLSDQRQRDVRKRTSALTTVATTCAAALSSAVRP